MLSRARAAVPLVALACAVLSCIAVSVALTTGYDSGTKLRQLVIRFVLVLPALLWMLRQSGEQPARRLPLRIAPFFLLFTLIVIPISWYTRDGIYNGDESAYRFEAKTLRDLHVWTQAPPEPIQPDFRFVHHVIYDGRWFGKYPPGWPALLAALSLAIPEWLVTPALGLLLLWLVYRIARSLYGERLAWTATALMACSPFFLFTCVGFMSHVACAVFVAMATLCLIKARDTHRTRDFVFFFCALGVAFLIRPYTAACVGTVLGSVLLWNFRTDRHQLHKIFALGLPILLLSVFALLYDNEVLTNHFWRSPYAVYDQSSLPTELNTSLPRRWHAALTITPASLARVELHSFPFLLLLAAYAVIQERLSRRSLLLALLPLSLILGHMITLRSDSFVGERYHFEAYFGIIILAAAGWEGLRARWKPSREAIVACVAACICLLVYQYVYVGQALIHFRHAYATIYETAEQLPGDRVLVFMDGSKYVDPHNFNPNSDQWQRERVLFAIDPGQPKRSLAASILGRPDWYVLAYDDQARHTIVEQQGTPR